LIPFSLIGEIADALVRVFPGGRENGVAAVLLVHAFLHPVIALVLVDCLAAPLRSDPAAVLGPSAFQLLVRVQFRFSRVREETAVLSVPLTIPIVAFLLVRVLASPWHAHHAAVRSEPAVQQVVGTVIVDRRERETFVDVVQGLEIILVRAILLVDAASPRHHSHLASGCGESAVHQIIAAVTEIGRHALFLEMRSKLAPEVTMIGLPSESEVKCVEMLWIKCI